MSACNFSVDISPDEAAAIVKGNESADLVYEESHTAADGKHISILVFEKYFFRAGNAAALTVIINNIEGATGVSAVAAGSSRDALFGFDWGAADDFAGEVRDILGDHVISE